MSKTYLICPLDWGLGHATRDIPIIKNLILQNHKVIIGADNQALELLKIEFPDIHCILFPSFFKIVYPVKSSMVLKMIVLIPKILTGIRKEHQYLKNIIKKYKIDCIISDNRFGLWNKYIYSIFITHQIHIKTPEKLSFFEPLLFKINHFFIKKYNECWVPDFEGNDNLSGELSHKTPLPKNIKYIGILSRFSNLKNSEKKHEIDICVILSGPEPQRTIVENRLINQLKYFTGEIHFIRGKPEDNLSNCQEIVKLSNVAKNIRFINHLSTYEFIEVISSSRLIICRSGYSSIMDLFTLGKKALLIPTPGQTEQEYLAEYLTNKYNFDYINQNQLNTTLFIEKINFLLKRK